MGKMAKHIMIAFVVMAVLLFSSFKASAQHQRGWQDKMRAERVAYLTEAMDLTSDEAEKFWPVYNEMETVRRASFGRIMKSLKALNEAIEAGKPSSEISLLLDNYLKAMSASKDVESKFVPKFTKILPVEKVAKLFIGEENFRRNQIGRWNPEK